MRQTEVENMLNDHENRLADLENCSPDTKLKDEKLSEEIAPECCGEDDCCEEVPEEVEVEEAKELGLMKEEEPQMIEDVEEEE